MLGQLRDADEGSDSWWSSEKAVKNTSNVHINRI